MIVSILLLTLQSIHLYIYMSFVFQGSVIFSRYHNKLVNNGMGLMLQFEGWKYSFSGVKAGTNNVIEDSVQVYRAGFAIFIFVAFLCEKQWTVSTAVALVETVDWWLMS